MSQVVTLRLPDETAERLRSCARRAGRSVNAMGGRLIEEWLRQDEFAEIEFRSFNGERHACIKGQLQVWQLVLVAKDYGLDVKKAAVHFRWPADRVQAGLNYYRRYPEEIDQAIQENNSMTEEKPRPMPRRGRARQRR